MKKLRILTLTHEFPPIGGGGGRVALQLGERLGSRGHQVDVVTMGFGELPRSESVGGMRVHRTSYLRRKQDISYTDEKIAWVLASLLKARALMRQHCYDLIHCHFIVPALLIPFLLRVCRKTPCVVTCHGSDVPGYNPDYYAREHRLMAPLWRRLAQNASVLITPSVALRNLIQLAAPKLTTKLSVIPYGYSGDRYKCSIREPKILLVTRMLPRKGVQYFLHAIEGIDIGYEVNIVGDGPYRSGIEALAKGARSNVKLWGWLDNDSPELKELYETSSIFVFPSESENFPVVLLEAMTAGLAIITTDVRGCPEVVGRTALLVPPRNPSAILERLRELIDHPAQIASLGDAARQRLLDHFDWPVVLPQYETMYESVLN